jgi:hypothetical protein
MNSLYCVSASRTAVMKYSLRTGRADRYEDNAVDLGERPVVRISVGVLSILTKVYLYFHKSFQANVGTVR